MEALRRWLHRLRPDPGTQQTTTRYARRCLLAVTGLAVLATLVWSRTTELSQGLINDEAATVVWYLRPGLDAIFSSASNNNNHQLFSVLAWATAQLLGEDEVVWRLWGVIPGIAAVVALAGWTWRRLGPVLGLTVGALLTVSPALLQSRAARGYGLVYLATALMIVGAAEALDGRRRGIIVFAAGGLIGLFTYEPMVVPFLITAGGLVVAGSFRRETVLAVGGVGVASLLWYAPILVKVLYRATDYRDHQRLSPLPVESLITGPADAPAWVVETVFQAGPESLLAGGVGVIVLLTGAFSLLRRGRGWLASILLAWLFGIFGLLVLGGYAIYPRYVSFLWIPGMFLTAVALVTVGEALWTRPSLRVLAAVTGGLLVFNLVSAYLGALGEATSHPTTAGQRAATAIRDFGPTWVLGVDVPFTTKVYLPGWDFRELQPERLKRVLCETDRRTALVLYERQIGAFQDSCLPELDARKFRFKHRLGKAVHLWLLEAGS